MGWPGFRPGRRRRAGGLFNGKLEAPSVASRAFSRAEREALLVRAINYAGAAREEISGERLASLVEALRARRAAAGNPGASSG